MIALLLAPLVHAGGPADWWAHDPPCPDGAALVGQPQPAAVRRRARRRAVAGGRQHGVQVERYADGGPRRVWLVSEGLDHGPGMAWGPGGAPGPMVLQRRGADPLRRRSPMMLTLPLLLLTGCGYKQLQTRVAVLELEVMALQEELAALEGGDGAQPLDEASAIALIQAYDAQLAAFELERAGQTLEALAGVYPGTKAWQHANKLREEYAVIGQPAPPVEVIKWFTPPAEGAGEPAMTLLIFWETWCPYCREEVPRLQAHADALEGLQVIGLSRVTGSSTEADVLAFVEEHGLTYAMGWEDGALTEAFGVRGIPAAAIVEDGVITWRGHPGKLDWNQIARRLE